MYRLDTIKLKDFLLVSENKNFSIITKSKKKKEWLKDNWSNLESHYKELFGLDEGVSKREKVINNVRTLESKLFLIKICCDALHYSYEQGFVDIMKDHGYLLDKENYLESIDQIIANSDSINIQIQTKLNSLPKPKNKDVEDYYRAIDYNIIKMCAVAEMDRTPNNITVMEYRVALDIVEEKTKNLNNAK